MGLELRILYFSGTGNTEYVVREIEKGLKEKHLDCQILAADKLLADCGLRPHTIASRQKLRSSLKTFLDGATMLLLAFPVHGSDVPRPLKILLPLLPDGNSTKLGVVSTLYRSGGDCCYYPGRILGKRGYIPILTGYVKMPNNMRLPHLDFFSIKNGSDLNSYYDHVKKKVEKIIDRLIDGKKDISGKGVTQYIFGGTQRFAEDFTDHWMGQRMFATANCVRCKLCAVTCPDGNISFKNDYPEFGSRCCLCLRCYNFCPQNAIQITDKTINTKKFERYKGFNGWTPPRLRKI